MGREGEELVQCRAGEVGSAGELYTSVGTYLSCA